MEKEKKINKYIGAHVSTTGGVQNAPKNAKEIGAKAFGMFLKNQRRWESKPYTEKEIEAYKKNMKENGYLPEQVLPHDSYLINLGSPDQEKREKSIAAFIDELKRAEALGLKYLNTHPGSHLNEVSEEEDIELIADSINKALAVTNDVIVVLENTAGQGSNMGYRFEHLAGIIDKVENKERIGVCIDTCHTIAAGYELKTEEGYNKTFDDFEKIVGFKYLKGVHLNDSKFDTGSKKDRHDSIGKGVLGTDFFVRFMNDSRFDNIPIILETVDENIWPDEIKHLYSLIN